MNQTYLREFHAQRINPKKDLIDFNDLAYISERVPDEIIGWQPIGVAKGKSHFNGTFFYHRGGKRSWVFHVKPIYYVNTFGAIRPMGEVFSHHGHRKLVLRQDWENMVDFGWLVWLMKRMELIRGNVFMPMSKVPLLINAFGGPYYPDPNVEVTSVDGGVIRSAVDQTFANIRSGIGTGFSDDQVDDFAPRLGASATTDQYASLRRNPTLFDASAIPDTDVISTATASVKGTAKTDQLSQSVTVVICAPASNTVLAASDYNIASWTMTQQNSTDITITSWSTTAYNDFALNATGIGNISKTSITKFGFVLSGDRTNTAPTWVASNVAQADGSSAETTGTTSDPKLSGTSSAAAAGIAFSSILLGRVG